MNSHFWKRTFLRTDLLSEDGSIVSKFSIRNLLRRPGQFTLVKTVQVEIEVDVVVDVHVQKNRFCGTKLWVGIAAIG